MSEQNNNRNLVIAFIAYFTFYYNRKCVTLVFPQLIKEGLTQQNAGTIVSSQSISMALVTFTAGVLSDKFPSKLLVSFGLMLCGVSTILFSMTSNITYYSIFWFLNGLGQGFSLPSLIKLTKESSHMTRFATNWSLVLVSVNIAGVLNPFISAFLTQTYDWRTSIVISAISALIVSVISYVQIEGPIDEKSIDTKSDTKKPKPEINRSDLLKNPLLLVCIICRFIVATTRLGVTDWSQIYLINEIDIDIYISSSFISLLEIGGIFGKIIGGRISDLLLKRALKKDANASKALARLPVSIGMMAINALALHIYCFYVNKNSSFLLLAITAILIGVTTAANVVNLSVSATEIGSKKYAGLCSSLVNLAAKVGGIITGLPLSLIAYYFSWNFSFILIEILCVLGVILQIVISKTQVKSKID